MSVIVPADHEISTQYITDFEHENKIWEPP